MMPAQKPLEGIRVIELARVLAGPWAGQLLADLGADVIKVEHPDGGDETRHWGPPFLTGANGENLSAAYFHACNRGKRSVALDLRKNRDLAALKSLIADADVLIENFKVGGLAKFGLDYASMRAANPALVYCSITGFGQNGPYKERAGYDFIIQGMSGFMSITGEPDGMPMKAGVAITDVLTGTYAVCAINATLVAALKTGRGAHLDIALFEVMSAALANQNMNFLATGSAPGRLGNAHPNIAPYQVVETRDGHIILAVGNDGQFSRFCAIIERPDLAQDKRFATNPGRVAHRDVLTAQLRATTVLWLRDDLVAACEGNAVPVGPINTVADMFADPHMVARGFALDMRDMSGNPIQGFRSPIFIDGQPMGDPRPSPRLGEHTKEVLGEIH